MNFIELCCGCGGLSSGLIKAGFIPKLLVDNDKNACETIKLNHPEYADKVICADINSIDVSVYNNVDLLAGGCPCQSFSLAGKKKGLEDSRGNLLLTFVNFINIIKPKMFMIENVKGLVLHNRGNTLKQILGNVNDYDIKYQILNAVDYGVPQKRERVFIIGCRSVLKLSYNFPEKILSRLTMRDVLKDCPLSQGSEYPEKKKKLFALIPQGGCWIDLPENLQREYMMSSFDSEGGKRGILRRLSLDEPCLTLLTSPSQKQTERCHPTEIRPLQTREYARIQSFPDDYKFVGSTNSIYKQIGNAVPVNLAYEIGKSIVECLK